MSFKGKYEDEVSDFDNKADIKNADRIRNRAETEGSDSTYSDSRVNLVASDWFVDDIEKAIDDKQDVKTESKESYVVSDTTYETSQYENQNSRTSSSKKTKIILIIAVAIVFAVAAAFSIFKLVASGQLTDYNQFNESDVLDNDEPEDTDFTDKIVTVERIGNEEYYYFPNGQIEYVLEYDSDDFVERVYFYINNEIDCYYDILLYSSEFRYYFREGDEGKYMCWYDDAPFKDYNLSELQENPYQFIPQWYTLTGENYYDDLGNLLYGFRHNFVRHEDEYIDYVEQYDENGEFVASWEDIYDYAGNLISTTND